MEKGREEGGVSWTGKDRHHSDVYVTRRSYETNVSSCEGKFKSSIDVGFKTSANNTKLGHNSLRCRCRLKYMY